MPGPCALRWKRPVSLCWCQSTAGVSALSGAPDAFSAFRQAALSGQNARLEAVSVAESGHVYLVSYYLEGSGAFCAQARLEYDETGAAHPGGPGQTDIENWQFTEKGNLIFELALSLCTRTATACFARSRCRRPFRMRQHSTWTP